MRTKLNAVDKAYIAGNFETMYVREMARHLGLLDDAIRIYMREEKLQTLYSRLKIPKSKELSAADEAFILSHYQNMNRAKLARAIDNTFHAVDLFLKSKQLKPFRAEKEAAFEPDAPKPKFERPPAVYSNVSYHH